MFIKSFSIIFIFLISLFNSISVDELWDYTLKKEKNNSSILIIDPDNKLSDSQLKEIEKSSNALFISYEIESYLFILKDIKEKDIFIKELIEKLNKTYKKFRYKSIFSIIILEQNYYYLNVGSEIEKKLKSKKLNKINEESKKLGYGKYFVNLMNELLGALIDFDDGFEDGDDDELIPIDDREYEDAVKKEYEKKQKEKEEYEKKQKEKEEYEKKQKEKEEYEKKQNIKEEYYKKDIEFGIYVLGFLLIIVICLVGVYVVHNYRRKLLMKKISVDIDYQSI